MRSACLGRGLVGGLIILVIGFIFLLDNFGVLAGNAIFRWWPLLLIVAGVSKLLAPSLSRKEQ
jgi:hypothetical protein